MFNPMKIFTVWIILIKDQIPITDGQSTKERDISEQDIRAIIDNRIRHNIAQMGQFLRIIQESSDGYNFRYDLLLSMTRKSNPYSRRVIKIK